MESFSPCGAKNFSLNSNCVKPFLLLLLVFCTGSSTCLAGNGGPSLTIPFDRTAIVPMVRDSVPQTNSGEEEKAGAQKEEGIKEVPKARKQVKPVAVGKVPGLITPATKSIIKPVIKPVVKPVIKPVIKPAIRIH